MSMLMNVILEIFKGVQSITPTVAHESRVKAVLANRLPQWDVHVGLSQPRPFKARHLAPFFNLSRRTPFSFSRRGEYCLAFESGVDQISSQCAFLSSSAA